MSNETKIKEWAIRFNSNDVVVSHAPCGAGTEKLLINRRCNLCHKRIWWWEIKKARKALARIMKAQWVAKKVTI